MDADHVIVAQHVEKRYGARRALAGVDLAVRRGEIFGVLGANGAGKTTLIKMLVGSARPSGGSVTVLGLDPSGDAWSLRQRIGYMPQAPALYDDLSVRDNIDFFGRAHVRDPRARVERTMELVELRARARDPVYSLSGGMKQRVSLACALVHEPSILFLDEPTAGVDPALREAFWRHFRALAAAGTTLLVSTHQMDEALACDRLAIMRDGVVLACEAPRALVGRGRARVRITAAGAREDLVLPAYATELPAVLQRHGLSASVSRIEVEPDSLETIVLGLIDARAATDARGETDARD